MPRAPRRLSALTTLVLLTAGLAAACGAVPKGSAMVPANLELDTRHAGHVFVEAHGSKRRMLVAPPLLSARALEEATTDALRNSRLFEGTAPRAEDAAWLLSVEARSLSAPEMGLDMEATVELRWVLTERTRGEVRWAATLETSHKANQFDADTIRERGRKALEGAVSRNVREALVQLADLDLDLDRGAQ